MTVPSEPSPAAARRAERLKAQAADAPGRRAVKTAAIEKRIRELVDQAPPLTPEQRDRIALLFRQAEQ